MIYFIFTVSIAIFGTVYYNRDKSQDAEKLKNCDLW